MVMLSPQLGNKIDSLLLRRRIGIPVFLLLMYFMFWTTFTLGSPFVSLLEFGIEKTLSNVNNAWPNDSWPLLRSLVTEGMISGVGGVLIFVPNIALLFLCIALLEKSGAMGRAARVMNSTMDKMGMHGKSFIPLLMGFGCNVPAMMATNIVENRRDRLATIFVIPLMSCSARFPIYTLFIPALFPSHWQAPVLWMIYLFGILLALSVAKLLSKTILHHIDDDEMPIELVPWNLPTVKELFYEAFSQAWLYIRKAGTVILGFSIILWALTVFPQADKSLPAEKQFEHSYVGRLGHFLEPVLKPAGMDWKIGTALIGAVAAKEVFVVQLGIVNAISNAKEDTTSQYALRTRIKEDYTPLSSICIMLFCLIGLPCISTIVAAWRAARSWRWALFQFLGLTFLAWLISVGVYQAVNQLSNIL